MYGAIALVLGLVGAGQYYGLDALVGKTTLMVKTPALRYVLG